MCSTLHPLIIFLQASQHPSEVLFLALFEAETHPSKAEQVAWATQPVRGSAERWAPGCSMPDPALAASAVVSVCELVARYRFLKFEWSQLDLFFFNFNRVEIRLCCSSKDKILLGEHLWHFLFCIIMFVHVWAGEALQEDKQHLSRHKPVCLGLELW